MAASAPRVEWLEQAGSTNAEARTRALAGECGPLWLAARRQTAGRGRRGRAWQSLDGNLFASGLYVIDRPPAQVAQLSFVTALAVAAVCDAALGDVARTRLKWPNDVLVDGHKVAGILLESGAAPGGGLWLAIGVGINLVAAPQDTERPAVALSQAGASLDREAALSLLAGAFESGFQHWMQSGFGAIRDRWLTRAHGLGERCVVRLPNETLDGVFGDLGPDGALRLDLASGQHRYISAGEVFFPGPGEES
ncbi:biotin--[acetyl-CoA-carboxylase] ligase [uncultured Maricaulis sp.]|uniref:biotin--[acetyl-CoA-carboxylase] ligase n=1 Tax=uncultured Maricaulis sp. TaxID=174710 RepID=UPI0030D97E12